ncbi:pyrroline-5-carboxylate reductase [Kribbella sp. NPDC051952]|uniref:pyrroline-5-carboxylate reductase n=1 Tax=Kribbella sp. NPDC051952 TaxID=3154851 RepID=UPI0034168888
MTSIDLAVVGAGNMGGAILAGLRKGETRRLAIVEPNEAQAARVTEEYGVRAVTLTEAVRARVLVITVKPHLVPGLLEDLAATGRTPELVITAAGGVTTERVEAALGSDVAVVRCMPNTAVAIGQGVIAISPGLSATPKHLAEVTELFAPLGQVIELPEAQLDAVTALSGSGPAYFCLLAEALIDAAVLLGIPRPAAETLVTQTAAGAGLMLRDLGKDPVALRAAVTSPGGVTIAAIHELERNAFRGAVMSAALAGRDRSTELGQQAST